MKRYLVFGFDRYYPGGGISDLIEAFDNEEKINEYFLSKMKEEYFNACDYYQILDIQTGDYRSYSLPK